MIHSRISFLFLFVAFSISVISCSKEPGPGGQASITGKLFVQNYSGNCTSLDAEFYGVDEDIYIIYGDDPSYSDNVNTGPGGVYWFPNLRKGKYTIYAISESCIPNAGDTIVSMQVEIKDRKETIEVPDLVVIR